MIKKWCYLGNKGVLAKGEEVDILKDHTNDRPEDASKFERVPFHVLRNLIQEAKDFVEAENAKKEEKKEEKPKRKRRTKAEIEADKAGK